MVTLALLPIKIQKELPTSYLYVRSRTVVKALKIPNNESQPAYWSMGLCAFISKTNVRRLVERKKLPHHFQVIHESY